MDGYGEIHRDRQTDWQGQTNRQRDRQAGKPTVNTDRDPYKQIEKQTGIKKERHTSKHIERHTDR